MNSEMKLIYVACFYLNEDGKGYTVTVPDLPGCTTFGNDLKESMEMAVDAASGWILGELEEGQPVPRASDIDDIVVDDELNINNKAFKSLIVLDMDSYADKYGEKSVRKNTTIPAWLNTFAENNNINFSEVLKDGLINIYNQKESEHNK
jgi:predicted RNase H-like HicB family nuclease